MTDDECPFAVLEDLLEHDDFALAFERECGDDVQRLVEHDFLALAKLLALDRRAHRDAQFPAAGKDVDGAVVVASEEHAVTRRGLSQPIDFFAQRNDLLAGFLQR